MEGNICKNYWFCSRQAETLCSSAERGGSRAALQLCPAPPVRCWRLPLPFWGLFCRWNYCKAHTSSRCLRTCTRTRAHTLVRTHARAPLHSCCSPVSRPPTSRARSAAVSRVEAGVEASARSSAPAPWAGLSYPKRPMATSAVTASELQRSLRTTAQAPSGCCT